MTEKKRQYIKNQIKIQLWSMGRHVKDLEGTPGIDYDLLINDDVRLSIFEEGRKSSCDVWARIEKNRRQYALDESELHWKTPTEIFGRLAARE